MLVSVEKFLNDSPINAAQGHDRSGSAGMSLEFAVMTFVDEHPHKLHDTLYWDRCVLSFGWCSPRLLRHRYLIRFLSLLRHGILLYLWRRDQLEFTALLLVDREHSEHFGRGAS